MKKRKLKKDSKKFLIMLILLCILLYGASYGINKYKNKTKTSNYSTEVLNKANDTIKNKLESSNYSKTLEEMLLNNIFNENYFDEYLSINYQDINNFLDNVNSFLKIGYKANEINNIFNLSDKNITKLLKLKYYDLTKFYNIKNFDADNIEKYNEYSKNNNLDTKEIVTQVNIGLDQEPYTNTKAVSDPNDYLVIVNKYNYLTNNYKPEDLTTLNGFYGSVNVRKVAADNFTKLQSDLKKETGVDLVPTTSFRGYGFQKTLYDNYVAKDGVKAADTYSARPGYSEHQTGLALDLKNPKLSDIRLSESDYSWIKNNAYKYGFIVRFPNGKESITGYQEENWHIRYVGEEHAKIIHDNNLTLEEYVELYIKEY